MRTILSALAALVVSAAPAFAQTVAFVTNMKGDASIDGARPALLAEVARGQKIVLAREAGLSAMYVASGKEYVLKGPGEWLVKDNEIAAASGMPPMVRYTEWHTGGRMLESVAHTSAASVRMRSVPANRPPQPVVLFPSAGRIATLQPTLRWRADAAQDKCEVAVYVPGEEKPVHAASAANGSYALPVPLKPDTEYVWTVSTAGHELGSGRFRTLAPDALHQVQGHRPGDKAEFSDRLLFAVMLQGLGAQQEAREAWLRLSQERADLPELAALAK